MKTRFFIIYDMNLNLNNDLAVFDIESTGLDVSSDRIVEIAVLKITPSGEQEEWVKRLNPQMPISSESTEIHGISDEDVQNAPTFKDVADDLAAFLGSADLAGFNSNKFDIPMLAEEFLRVDHSFDVSNRKFIDVQNIFHKMEQRTLVAAYKFYCNKDLNDAHNASADTNATFEVLKAQIERYEDLKGDIEYLSEFSKNTKHEIIDFAGRLAKNKDGKPIYNFGKHKGKTIEEVANQEPGYYGWMLNGNFPRYTKAVLKAEMERIKAERQRLKAIRKEKEQQKMETKIDALKNKFGQ